MLANQSQLERCLNDLQLSIATLYHDRVALNHKLCSLLRWTALCVASFELHICLIHLSVYLSISFTWMHTC